jgi:hypothetical protein
MTLGFKSVSTYQGMPEAASILLPAPAGVSNGDLLIFFGAQFGGANVPMTLPLGVTWADERQTGEYTGRCILGYRYADNEPAEYECAAGKSPPGNQRQIWTVTCWRDALWVDRDGYGGAGLPDWTIPSVTCAALPAIWIGMVAAGWIDRSYTWPEGWSELWDISQDGTYSGATAWVAATGAYVEVLATGATGTATVIPSSAVNPQDGGFSVLIGPAVAPPAGGRLRILGWLHIDRRIVAGRGL